MHRDCRHAMSYYCLLLSERSKQGRGDDASKHPMKGSVPVGGGSHLNGPRLSLSTLKIAGAVKLYDALGGLRGPGALDVSG
jgi:hypothetical protein